MALEKTPYWTDLYYQVVEHYFWTPRRIGRVPDKSKPSHHWRHWEEKLRHNEEPLNHIMNFLFHIAPEELLDHIASTILGRRASGLKLVAIDPKIIDNSVVQPDITLSNGSSVVFLELKVDSRSSVDQFAKYAIAANCLMQHDPALTTADLVVLARHPQHDRIWAKGEALGIGNEESLRKVALQGLNGKAGIWTQPGVQKYIKSNPEQVPNLATRIAEMGVTLSSYEPVGHALREYAVTEKAVARLIEGLLKELENRDLV